MPIKEILENNLEALCHSATCYCENVRRGGKEDSPSSYASLQFSKENPIDVQFMSAELDLNKNVKIRMSYENAPITIESIMGILVTNNTTLPYQAEMLGANVWYDGKRIDLPALKKKMVKSRVPAEIVDGRLIGYNRIFITAYNTPINACISAVGKPLKRMIGALYFMENEAGLL